MLAREKTVLGLTTAADAEDRGEVFKFCGEPEFIRRAELLEMRERIANATLR